MLTSTKRHLLIPHRRLPTPLLILRHQSRSGFDDDEMKMMMMRRRRKMMMMTIPASLPLSLFFVISDDQYDDE